jgi:hypothetical protein
VSAINVLLLSDTSDKFLANLSKPLQSDFSSVTTSNVPNGGFQLAIFGGAETRTDDRPTRGVMRVLPTEF